MLDGLLTDVEAYDRGTVALAAVTADPTQTSPTIPIDDPTDFSADGGEVDVLGETYPYTTITTDEAGNPTLVLEEPLRVDVLESDPILLRAGNQIATDIYAVVDLGGAGQTNHDAAGEPVRIPIPYHQRAVWPIRHYDPPWPVYVTDDLASIEQVPGLTPIIDGGLIDPGTLPEAGPTAAPTESPTPRIVSGSGAAVVRFDPVPDATTYDLHVTTDDTETVGETNLHTSNVNPPIWVSYLDSDGTTGLSTEADSYFALVARNDLGAAPPSAWVPGRAGLIDNDILTSSLVVAQEVVAELIETRGLRIGTSTWDIDNGFSIPGVIQLPVDGSQDAFLYSNLVTDSVTINDNLSIRGQNNVLESGSDLTLGTGVSDPQTPPSIQGVWPRTHLGTMPNLNDGGNYNPGGAVGIAEDLPDRGGFLLAAQNYLDGAGNRVAGSSAIYRARPDNTELVFLGLRGPVQRGGIARTPNCLWTVGWDANASQWWIYCYAYTSAAPYPNPVASYSPNNPWINGRWLGIVGDPDADRIYVIGTRIDNGNNIMRRYSNPNAGPTINFEGQTTLDVTGTYNWAGGYIGDPPGLETGGRSLIAFPKAGAARAYNLDTGTAIAGSSFPAAGNREVAGVCTSPQPEASLVTLDIAGRASYANLYSHVRWNTHQRTLAYTWYDTPTTEKPAAHESVPSPEVNASNIPAAAFLQITTPTPPTVTNPAGDPLPESPDAARIYASSSEDDGNLHLQTVLDTEGTSTRILSVILERYIAGGGAPPDPPGDFDALNFVPARLRSALVDTLGPMFALAGDGSIGYDTGNLTPLAPFTGWARFIRFGPIVFCVGSIVRLSGSQGAFLATGIVLPAGLRPAQSTPIPASVNRATGTPYQFQITSAGALNVSQYGDFAAAMALNGFYLLG